VGGYAWLRAWSFFLKSMINDGKSTLAFALKKIWCWLCTSMCTNCTLCNSAKWLMCLRFTPDNKSFVQLWILFTSCL